MTQAPDSPKPDRAYEAQHAAAISAAARTLACLIARQAAGEFLRECAQDQDASDHDPQDKTAG